MSNPLRNWCFTWHRFVENGSGLVETWTENDLGRLTGLVESDSCKYIIFQQERCPETGRIHLQGFIALKSAMRMTGVKKLLDPVKGATSPIHLEGARGTAEQSKAYCSKEESRVEGTQPYEAGEIPAAGKKKDYSQVLADLRDSPSVAEFAEQHPDIAIKHFSNVSALHAAMKSNTGLASAREVAENINLRPVQDQIKEIILASRQTSTGKVIWFYDKHGQVGKTTLAKYIMCTMADVLYLENAKTADLAHAWGGQSLVIFDIPRSLGEDRLNIGAIESLSNGVMFSAKYNSQTKICSHICVVVFSNTLPPWYQLSLGRWIAYDVTNGKIRTMPDPRHLEIT